VLALVFISPPDGRGQETFSVTVCSPPWFAEQMAHDEIRSGYHTIFMHEFSYPKLHAFVERAVHRIEAPTWPEVVERFSWFALPV